MLRRSGLSWPPGPGPRPERPARLGDAARVLRTAILAIVAASALIAVTSLLAKVLGRGLTGPELHPLQVSAGRFCFALAGLSVAGLLLRPKFAGAAWRLHVGRSLFGWLGVTCLFAAAARMPLAEATAVSFLSPLAAMVLAVPFLGDRIGAVRWGAAAIALAGALLLIRPGTAAFQPIALVALAAALLMGVEVIFIKKLATREPALRILMVNNAIGSAVSLAAAAFVWTAPSPGQWTLLVALGLTMACGQFLFIQAMKRAEASYVMPFFYSTLIFASFYDLALFGERPDALAIGGATAIVAGAVLLARFERTA